MKRCPTCNRTFTDRSLSFCIDDGTPLVAVPEAEEPTVMLPEPQSGSTHPSQPQNNSWKAQSYQPPGSHVPSTSQGARSAWPWVVGILAVVLLGIIGLGVAAALILPRMLRASANRNDQSINANLGNANDANSNADSEGSNSNSDSGESNTNSNLNVNENSSESGNADEGGTSPPTDPAKVLSALTDLENEWTRANINADKKALDKILADDFVGTAGGKTQGKAEYIRTIERDTAIEKWHFDDLKLDLKGDRGTLTGILKFVVSGLDLNFRFTDKFVWRDGRWQATSSEVDPVK